MYHEWACTGAPFSPTHHLVPAAALGARGSAAPTPYQQAPLLHGPADAWERACRQMLRPSPASSPPPANPWLHLASPPGSHQPPAPLRAARQVEESARAAAAPPPLPSPPPPAISARAFAELCGAPPLQGGGWPGPRRFAPLDMGCEAPRAGGLVAIDAEFVAISRQEASIGAERGGQVQLKPSRCGAWGGVRDGRDRGGS